MSNSPDNLKYKTYRSEEVVQRSEVRKGIIEKVGKKAKEIFILEGDRGAGKTTALLELYKYYQSQPEFAPFFIGLFQYEAAEFAGADNLWISSSSDGRLEEKDILELLKKITDYLNIKFIKSLDDDIQREYLSKELSQKQSKKRLVLIVDSIYECSDETRRNIENYFLIPALSSNQVTIILSGRGRRPVWTSPEFRDAQIVPLISFGEQQVKEQLKKFNSKHLDQWNDIKDWSGGFPLVVRILGEGKEISEKRLSLAVDILIRDALKSEYQPKQKEIRAHIERLSLFQRDISRIGNCGLSL
jgi:tRNA A37 threonylcarbamoyladenosine biosynthesis protein TsaE